MTNDQFIEAEHIVLTLKEIRKLIDCKLTVNYQTTYEYRGFYGRGFEKVIKLWNDDSIPKDRLGVKDGTYCEFTLSEKFGHNELNGCRNAIVKVIMDYATRLYEMFKEL